MKFPTGGIPAISSGSPRALQGGGQQIWLHAKADGYSPDGRERVEAKTLRDGVSSEGCLFGHRFIPQPWFMYYFEGNIMNQSLLGQFGSSVQRVENALCSLKNGSGVLVTDSEDRENEGDLIFSSHFLTVEQMALLIRECSGIVCLCLTEKKVAALGLPMMVNENTSRYQTAFTVSIEARQGVTTGVSAQDRVCTVKAATSENATFSDISTPGHIFPLKARPGGVLEREGHTEATVDLMALAGLPSSGVLCELTNADGSMARLPELSSFAKRHNFPLVTIEDLIDYRKRLLTVHV